MKRRKKSQKIESQMKEFLKKNPAIKEALRVFDITYNQYKKTMEGGFHFYNDTSTSPRSRTIQKIKSK